jgi:hypothetical protein
MIELDIVDTGPQEPPKSIRVRYEDIIEMVALLREHAARCLFPSQPCEAWTAKHPEEKTCRPCRVRALLARIDGEP